MVKSATTPLDPAPVTFLGAPNGTTPSVNFILSYHSFNSTNVVAGMDAAFLLKDSTHSYAEVITKSAAQPEFQLFFTEDE